MINKYRNQGFILLMVLLILQIVILITFESYQSWRMIFKTNQHLLVRLTAKQEARHLLFKLSKRIPFLIMHCQVTKMSSHQLETKSVAWWQQHACPEQGKLLNSFLIIELLKEDDCAQFSNDRKYTAVFYRISLFGLMANLYQGRILLQQIYLRPKKRTMACQEIPHKIRFGLQSERELFNRSYLGSIAL